MVVSYADGVWMGYEADGGGVAGDCWEESWEELHDFVGWVDGKSVVEGLGYSQCDYDLP